MAYSDNEHLHPYGTYLYYSTDDISYVEINDLASLEGPEATRKPSNDTTLQSPNRLLLATPGWVECNDPPFSAYLHKTQMNTLYGYFWSRTTLYFKLAVPLLSTESSPSYFKFQGYFSKFKPVSKAEQSSDDKLMVEYAIHVTTKPTLTTGS